MPLHLAVSPSPQASRALMSFSLGFGRGLMSKRGTPAPEDLAGQGGLVETKGSRGCLGAVGGDVPGGNAGDSWSRCSRPKGLTSRIAWNLSLSWKPCGRPPASAAPGTQTRDGGRLVARAARGFRAQSMLTEARSCAGQPGPGAPQSGAADLMVAWSGSRATRIPSQLEPVPSSRRASESLMLGVDGACSAPTPGLPARARDSLWASGPAEGTSLGHGVA